MHAGGVGLSVGLVPGQGGDVTKCLDRSMSRHIQSGTASMFQLSGVVGGGSANQ